MPGISKGWAGAAGWPGALRGLDFSVWSGCPLVRWEPAVATESEARLRAWKTRCSRRRERAASSVAQNL